MSERACENCARDDDDLVAVHRVYVVPESWDTPASAQMVDDVAGHTLMTVSSNDLTTGKKTENSVEVGKRIAARAKDAGITKVVFDRAGYKYHGRVKAVADGAREGGLEF